MAPVVRACCDAPLLFALLLWPGSSSDILERRPCVTSLSRSCVPTQLHESRLCGECGWLRSCDYSLTHLAQTPPTHSPALIPSFHLNHWANIVDGCLSRENSSSLPDHSLSEGPNITNTTLAFEITWHRFVCPATVMSWEKCIASYEHVPMLTQKASRQQGVVLASCK